MPAMRQAEPDARQANAAEAARAALCGIMATYGLVLSNREEWRAVPGQPLGEIIGLHTIRGRLLCTNGVLAYVVRDDNVLQLCHLEWFKRDKVSPTSSGKAAATAEKVASLMKRYNI